MQAKAGICSTSQPIICCFGFSDRRFLLRLLRTRSRSCTAKVRWRSEKRTPTRGISLSPVYACIVRNVLHPRPSLPPARLGACVQISHATTDADMAHLPRCTAVPGRRVCEDIAGWALSNARGGVISMDELMSFLKARVDQARAKWP